MAVTAVPNQAVGGTSAAPQGAQSGDAAVRALGAPPRRPALLQCGGRRCDHQGGEGDRAQVPRVPGRLPAGRDGHVARGNRPTAQALPACRVSSELVHARTASVGSDEDLPSLSSWGRDPRLCADAESAAQSVEATWSAVVVASADGRLRTDGLCTWPIGDGRRLLGPGSAPATSESPEDVNERRVSSRNREPARQVRF